MPLLPRLPHSLSPARLLLEQPTIDFVSGGTGSDVFYQMSGLEALMRNLEMLPQAYQDVVGYELADIAEDIIREAKEKYVPYSSGALSDSGGSDEYKPGKMGFSEIGMWFAASDTRFISLRAAAAQGSEFGLQSTKSGRPAHMRLKNIKINRRARILDLQGNQGYHMTNWKTIENITGFAAFDKGELNEPHPEDYAVYQHESPDLKHPLDNPGNVPNPQYKFLERPFLDSRKYILDRIIARINEIEAPPISPIITVEDSPF